MTSLIRSSSSSSYGSSMTESTKCMTPLAANFVPGPHDVICAKGKKALTHSGNRWYRSQIQESLQDYANASSRHKKSTIVSCIVDLVRSSSPNGGFVKLVDSQWYEVGDHLAREKVGQAFRDGLHGLYKSSTRAKRRKMRAVKQSVAVDVENLIQSNTYVKHRRDQLTREMKNHHSSSQDKNNNKNNNNNLLPDLFVSNMFTTANLDILESLKKDVALVTEFQRATSSSGSSIGTTTTTDQDDADDGILADCIFCL